MRISASSKMMLVVITLVLAAPAMVAIAANSGTISGVVTQNSGQPAPGAFVQAKNVDLGVTTTVISQDQGRFTVSNLLPGKYVMRALGGGLQNQTQDPVTLGAGQKLSIDLALVKDQNYREASTAAHDLTMLPDGKEKEFIHGTCGLCHKMGFEEIVMSRRDRQGWMDIIAKMRNHPFGNPGSANITDAERDMLVDFFVKNLNPDVPPVDEKASLPRSWVTGPATKEVIVEFDMPKGAYPHDIDADPKGGLWVSERELGYIDRVDLETETYKRYKVPGDSVRLSDAIATDPKGNAWFVDSKNNSLLEFNPGTESFTSFVDSNPGDRLSANTIRFRADGTVWFTGNKSVVKFDPSNKQFSVYSSGQPQGVRGGPYGLAVDAKGDLWTPEQDAMVVGKVDAETGKFTTLIPPTANSIPRRMGSDWDGNPWFAEFAGDKLVKIDYRTGAMTEYPTPTKYSTPYSVDSDKVNKLIWMSECFADKMARFDPRTKTFVEYPLPEHHMSIRKIAVDPTHPTRVFFGEPARDRVGYIEAPAK